MSDVPSKPGAVAHSTSGSWKVRVDRFAFPGILLLAIALRLWGVLREDLWYDEIATVKYLNEPTVGQFLTEMQLHNPPVQPLYPVLEYYWYHLFGKSELALRLFSLILIVPTLFLVKVVGERMASRRAGLIAAFMVAASHVSIYYSLEVRMYAMTLCLSGLSLYSLLRLTDSNKPLWWMVNVLCTVLIVWTHILGVFFLVCQFVFVVWQFREADGRRAILWCGLQALAVASILPWLLGADVEYIREQYVFRETPTIFGLNNLSVQQLYALWIGPPPAAMAGDFERVVLVNLNRVMYVGFVAALVYLARRLYLGMRTRDAEARDVFNRELLVALVAVIPVLTLYLLSVLWEPSFFDRYVLVSLIGLALAMGMAVDRITSERLRNSAIGGLVIVAGLQAILYLQTPARRPWTEAERVIASLESEPVHVRLYGGSSEIMMTEAEYHLKSENIASIEPYEDLEVMKEEFLRRYANQGASEETDLVITFSTESAGHLLRYFKGNDVAYTSRVLESRMPLICIELGGKQ